MKVELIVLKPQDLVVLFGLLDLGQNDWTQKSLADELEFSVSTISDILDRLQACHLYNRRHRTIYPKALYEVLVYGVRHFFPATRGPVVRGMPTGAAGPPLANTMDTESLKWPPVWADASGTIQGYAIAPLHHAVPIICNKNERLYELLSLTDVFRESRPRERQIAIRELQKILFVEPSQIGEPV